MVSIHMLINTRCTVCGSAVDRDDVVTCEDCGRQLHAQCEAFERSFECRRCADEREVGAVEF